MFRPKSLRLQFSFFLGLALPVVPVYAQVEETALHAPIVNDGPGDDFPEDEPWLDEPQVDPPVSVPPGVLPPPPAGFGQTTPAPNGADKLPNPFTQPAPPQPRRSPAEIRLRGIMSDFGLDDATKQDAVIAYLAEDEKGKETVRIASNRLMAGIMRRYPQERIRVLLVTFKAAIDSDKSRRRTAQIALDAKIGYSLDPRVEASLYLFGVLGEGPSFLGNAGNRPGNNRNNPSYRRDDNRPDGKGDGKADGKLEYGGGKGDFPPGLKVDPAPLGGMAGPVMNGGIAFGTGVVTILEGPQIPAMNAAPRLQTGTVYGTVTQKGEGWIDVRPNGANPERFVPNWVKPVNGAPGTFDKAVLDSIAQVNVGDSIKLKWIWSQRKRVVQLEPWAAEDLKVEPAKMGAEPAPQPPAQNTGDGEPVAPQENNQP